MSSLLPFATLVVGLEFRSIVIPMLANAAMSSAW
jgi:hypothetical protein